LERIRPPCRTRGLWMVCGDAPEVPGWTVFGRAAESNSRSCIAGRWVCVPLPQQTKLFGVSVYRGYGGSGTRSWDARIPCGDRCCLGKLVALAAGSEPGRTWGIRSWIAQNTAESRGLRRSAVARRKDYAGHAFTEIDAQVYQSFGAGISPRFEDSDFAFINMLMFASAFHRHLWGV